MTRQFHEGDLIKVRPDFPCRNKIDPGGRIHSVCTCVYCVYQIAKNKELIGIVTSSWTDIDDEESTIVDFTEDSLQWVFRGADHMSIELVSRLGDDYESSNSNE